MNRNNEGYLNAVEAQRIPDPTTAGDFTRRFTKEDIGKLMECINTMRSRVWKEGRKEKLKAVYRFKIKPPARFVDIVFIRVNI